MNIIISGYGRMGHEVENVAIERNHKIKAIVDNDKDWLDNSEIIKKADVVIDFSLPESALDIFSKCFSLGVPIVTGTTGWYENIEKVRNYCLSSNSGFFYSHNFSIGVNIFFEANRKLSKMLNSVGGYGVSMEEVHHIHKLDSPSGTAIKAAEDIIEAFDNIDKWKNQQDVDKGELPIISKRENEVNGDHSVFFESDIDSISLSHSAKSRKGFAQGSVIAAEFMVNKKGFFTMKDLLDFS